MKKLEELFVQKDNRTLTIGEKVEVYFNLTQGGFSIVSRDKQNKDKGKVVAYAQRVLIEDATFHINPNKLEQIREKQRKTVYAVVRGIYKGVESFDNSHHRKGYCNPYKTGKFIDWDTNVEITKADEVYFYDKFFSYHQTEEPQIDLFK